MGGRECATTMKLHTSGLGKQPGRSESFHSFQLLHGPITVPDTFRVYLVSSINSKLKITSDSHAYLS